MDHHLEALKGYSEYRRRLVEGWREFTPDQLRDLEAKWAEHDNHIIRQFAEALAPHNLKVMVDQDGNVTVEPIKPVG